MYLTLFKGIPLLNLPGCPAVKSVCPQPQETTPPLVEAHDLSRRTSWLSWHTTRAKFLVFAT